MSKKNPIWTEMLPEWLLMRSGKKKNKIPQLKAAEILKKKHGLVQTVGSIRVKMQEAHKRYIESLEDDATDQDNDSDSDTSTGDGYVDISQDDKRLQRYCKEKGIPMSWVESAKWVNHNGQEEFNIVLRKPVEKLENINFDSIIKKYGISRKEVSKIKNFSSGYLFDRLVYTDTHVGMEPNENDNSLYYSKWDEEELMDACKKMASHVIQNKKSDILIIDDLGDFADGWSGQTARGGHPLPQNMTNEETFDCGLNFKVSLIDYLIEHYDKIICHNVCNSNHAGNGFDYVINSAFKSVIEALYDNVEVHNYTRFIQHYEISGYYFILTHGKDDKNLKFGFKPILDSDQEKKIINYIERSKIPRGARIEFSKGDSHQYIFDNATSDLFNYYNYPALSPSSDWVKSNFQYGKSGVVLFNYRKNGTKAINDLIFNNK